MAMFDGFTKEDFQKAVAANPEAWDFGAKAQPTLDLSGYYGAGGAGAGLLSQDRIAANNAQQLNVGSPSGNPGFSLSPQGEIVWMNAGAPTQANKQQFADWRNSQNGGNMSGDFDVTTLQESYQRQMDEAAPNIIFSDSFKRVADGTDAYLGQSYQKSIGQDNRTPNGVSGATTGLPQDFLKDYYNTGAGKGTFEQDKAAVEDTTITDDLMDMLPEGKPKGMFDGMTQEQVAQEWQSNPEGFKKGMLENPEAWGFNRYNTLDNGRLIGINAEGGGHRVLDLGYEEGGAVNTGGPKGEFNDALGVSQRPDSAPAGSYLPAKPEDMSEENVKNWHSYYRNNPELQQHLSLDERQDLKYLDYLTGNYEGGYKEYKEDSYALRNEFGLDRHYSVPGRDSHRFEYQYEAPKRYDGDDIYGTFADTHEDIGGFYKQEGKPGQGFIQETLSKPAVGIALALLVPAAAPAFATAIGVADAVGAAILGGGMSALKGGDIGDIITGAAGSYIGAGGLSGASNSLAAGLNVSTDIADSIIQGGFELVQGGDIEDALAAGLTKYAFTQGGKLAQELKGKIGESGDIPQEELDTLTEFDTDKYDAMMKPNVEDIAGGQYNPDGSLKITPDIPASGASSQVGGDRYTPTNNPANDSLGGDWAGDDPFLNPSDTDYEKSATGWFKGENGETYKRIDPEKLGDWGPEDLQTPLPGTHFGYTQVGDRFYVTRANGTYAPLKPGYSPETKFKLEVYDGLGNGTIAEKTLQEWMDSGLAEWPSMQQGLAKGGLPQLDSPEWQSLPNTTGPVEIMPIEPETPVEKPPLERPDTAPIEQPEIPKLPSDSTGGGGGGGGDLAGGGETGAGMPSLPPLENPPPMPIGGTTIPAPDIDAALDVFDDVADWDPSILVDTVDDILKASDLAGDAEDIASQIEHGETEGVPQEVVDGLEEEGKTTELTQAEKLAKYWEDNPGSLEQAIKDNPEAWGIEPDGEGTPNGSGGDGDTNGGTGSVGDGTGGGGDVDNTGTGDTTSGGAGTGDTSGGGTGEGTDAGKGTGTGTGTGTGDGSGDGSGTGGGTGAGEGFGSGGKSTSFTPITSKLFDNFHVEQLEFIDLIQPTGMMRR